MIGAMARCTAQVYVVDRLISGARSASSVIAEARGSSATASGAATGAALVALSPERVVWWRGWSSGTVMAA
jgi:hypothetical protein